MERIKVLSEYKDLIQWNKKRFGAVNTNCFLMATNLQGFIAEERLFAQPYEDGLAIFIDEGSYYNLYYFWKPDTPLADFRQEKPVLIEELNNNGSRTAYLENFESVMYQAGFERIRNNLQVEATSKNWTDSFLQEYSQRLSRLAERGFFLELCCDPDTMRQAVSLWKTHLDITDIPQDHLVLKENDTVMNILDADRNVVATTWWRINGKSSESRHTVTRPDYYQNGLATLLLYTWVKHTAENGATRWLSWISDENFKSLATYGKLGFRSNGRSSKQYILK